MYTNFHDEIDGHKGSNFLTYFFIVLIAVVLTLILADLIFGAEVVSEWLGSVVYKLIN